MAGPQGQFRALAGSGKFRRGGSAETQPRSIEPRRRREDSMSNRLQGKVALVTAAGQGIGRAIAEAFVAEGAKVIATDVEQSKLADLVGAERHKLDVPSTPDVEALAKAVARQAGPPNVLVNCAGYVHSGSVLDCSEDDW